MLITGAGAAIATLDSVFLKQNLNDPSIEVSTKVFGLPRTGNQAWADLVDATVRPCSYRSFSILHCLILVYQTYSFPEPL